MVRQWQTPGARQVKIQVLVKEAMGRLQSKWWKSRERMLKRAHEDLAKERAMHMSQRAWNHELQRDMDAQQTLIVNLQAQAKNPLPEAKKLLRLIEEITAPIYIRSGEINGYELKCWMDDYRQYKKEHGG